MTALQALDDSPYRLYVSLTINYILLQQSQPFISRAKDHWVFWLLL